MERMVPESFHDRWDGRHWRWWALLAGGALTVAALALAAILATILDQDIAPLAFLFVTIILFSFSIVGSGMFDGLSGRAISGGLARQPTEENRAAQPAPDDADRARRDRRSIRSGLAALPSLVAFLTLLFA
jgi:hypothetical protein